MKEIVKEKAEKALKRAIKAEEIQIKKVNKVIKSRLKQLDMDVWKLVNTHKDVFINSLAIRRDIRRIERGI